MNTSTWYVICYIDKNGEKNASIAKLNGTDNVAAYVRDFPGLLSMNACKTKKVAFAIATAWREGFRNAKEVKMHA